MRNLQLLIVAMVGALTGCSHISCYDAHSKVPYELRNAPAPATLKNDSFRFDGLQFDRSSGRSEFKSVFLKSNSTGAGPFIWFSEGGDRDVVDVSAMKSRADVIAHLGQCESQLGGRVLNSRGISIFFKPNNVIDFIAVSKESNVEVSLSQDSARVKIPCTLAELESKLGKPTEITLYDEPSRN